MMGEVKLVIELILLGKGIKIVSMRIKFRVIINFVGKLLLINTRSLRRVKKNKRSLSEEILERIKR